MKTDNTTGVARITIKSNGKVFCRDENGNIIISNKESLIKIPNSTGTKIQTTSLKTRLEVKNNNMKTLKNIKPGDWVKMQVSEIEESCELPIRVATSSMSSACFTKNGEVYKGGMQVIFPLEEHEQPAFKERWMMVSNDEKYWFKRKVFAYKKGYHIAWKNAETDEEVQKSMYLTPWKFAKEIEEEQPKELSLEERVKILEEKLSKV
jgi:hypothetical protein